MMLIDQPATQLALTFCRSSLRRTTTSCFTMTDSLSMQHSPLDERYLNNAEYGQRRIVF
jgi:hypothetical protein